MHWYERLNFLEAFFRITKFLWPSQIRKRLFFITNFGKYCYIAMPFGLKIVGVTYQRMVNGVFLKLIRDVIEDYVVKSAKDNNHVACLQKVFDIADSKK